MSGAQARRQITGTARWIAASRARESARADRLFDDPWAATLAGDDGFAMLAAREQGGQPNEFLPVRTRFFDDLIGSAVQDWPAGPHQVVLLGAGLDTRAFRLDLPPAWTVYELDHPEVLAAKAEVLDGVTARCGRRTVPADLGDDWPDRLLDAGFDPAAATVWIVEGVLFYLPSPQVQSLLVGAAHLSTDRAVLGADAFGTGLLQLPAMRPLVEHRTATGVPLPFCTDDPGALLTSAGWQPRSVLDVGQPGANFGRLAPVPAGWDGGADPTTRSYLLVGSRE